MKKIRKTLPFFKECERYIVWIIFTNILIGSLMQLSVFVYKLKLPVIAWRVLIENVNLFGLVASLVFFSLDNSNRRKQAEKMDEIAERTKIIAKQEEQDRKIIGQQETDIRLEKMLNVLQEKVDTLQSQSGRLTAQIYQIEGEAELRRKVNELEYSIKKSCK